MTEIQLTPEQKALVDAFAVEVEKFLANHVRDYYCNDSNWQKISDEVRRTKLPLTLGGLEIAFKAIKGWLETPQWFVLAVRALDAANLPVTLANAEKIYHTAVNAGCPQNEDGFRQALEDCRASLPHKGAEVDLRSAESLAAIRDFLDRHESDVFSSPKNRGIILDWLQERRLPATPSNLETALAAVRTQLDAPRRAKPMASVMTTTVTELSPGEIAKRQLANQSSQRGLEGTPRSGNRDGRARQIAAQQAREADARVNNFTGNR